MANSMMIIRAAGNQEMINSLLPVFESPELEEAKRERDWYKMQVDIQKPRRKATLRRDLKHARTHYVVRRPMLPARIVLGIYGLLISMFVGFFKGIEHISKELTNYTM